MTTYIALFRGINVGGKNLLPMKDLAALCENLGYQNVRTYIQSGNVVFQDGGGRDAAQISSRIGAAVREHRGFEPDILLLEREEMKRALEANPFPEAEAEPRTLHLNFLDDVPAAPDLDALEGLKKTSERFSLRDRVFYLHAPDGIGRSRLAARAERLLGVTMTGRNWRTACKVMEMAETLGDV